MMTSFWEEAANDDDSVVDLRAVFDEENFDEDFLGFS